MTSTVAKIPYFSGLKKLCSNHWLKPFFVECEPEMSYLDEAETLSGQPKYSKPSIKTKFNEKTILLLKK